MVNYSVVVVVVVAIVACTEAKPQLPGVPREFQNVNIENYLRNARAVQFQLKCLIYDGPCDTIGKYLKRNIPVWLRTQCKNCNDDQKVQAGKLINFFQENYPKEWDDAIAKFGKVGGYTPEEVAQFESELGVTINRDPSKPVVKGKPDHNALANLAKESIAILKTTKEPLIIGSKDSSTTVTSPPIPDPSSPASA